MKQGILILALLMASFSNAGLSDLQSAEFNDMISEASKTKAEIQREFQKTIENNQESQDQEANVAPLELSSETVFVETKKADFFETPRVPAKTDKLKRVAEEMKALD